MISEAAVWLILILPFAACGLIGLIVRPFFNRYSVVAGWITIGAIAVSFGLSVWALSSVVSEGPLVFDARQWVVVAGLRITFGALVDPLTAIMLVTVCGVSLLVQIYSQGYMKGDTGYARYFAFMALFTGSMLGLVLARNIVQLFVFWELVGASSYLLIGFWFHKPSAAAAAKKAFIVTRFGDFAFLLAILYLFTQGGGLGQDLLDIPTLYAAIGGGLITSWVATWVALGIFSGAVGKSAQFPLHTWLPDAMEGPTPVSALIHSATMVTAGVFLVARFLPLFELSAGAMNTVALIGGGTAVFAATMGLVSNDIKRVLAYSTISQLGYMMLALGVGAYGAAVFHLFTHAWFKAMLFLAAGSANHATGTFDMRFMGGLRRVMPWTYGVVLVGGLSLAGIFPLSGFWSKDEILAGALEQETIVGYVVLALGALAVVMTAFYMFRALFMTFHGNYRGGAEAEAKEIEAEGGTPPEVHGHPHLGESPWVMVGPMVVLAVLAIVIGFLVNPPVDIGVSDKHAMATFVTSNDAVFPTHDDKLHAGAEPEINLWIAGGSTVLALAGVVLAYLMYVRVVLSPASLGRRFRSIHTLFYRRYYFDELYEDVLVRRFFYGGVAKVTDWVDRNWIDSVNGKIAAIVGRVGSDLRQVQSGQAQTYGLGIAGGLLVAIVAFLIWGT